jgi:hypothetical protein
MRDIEATLTVMINQMKKHSDRKLDSYIAKCPKEVQGKLKKIRAAIWEVAPGVTERTDYFQIPVIRYSYLRFES